jgi:hypothetical protein
MLKAMVLKDHQKEDIEDLLKARLENLEVEVNKVLGELISLK